MKAEQFLDSLKSGSGESQLANVVIELIQKNRVDVADEYIKRGLEANDEDPALQVVSCVVSIFKGEYDEAYATLNELIQKHGDSPLLLNNYAICAMQDGNLEEAEQALIRALDISTSMNSQDYLSVTLANLISLRRQQDAPYREFEQRLASISPDDDYFTQLRSAEELFERCLQE